MFFFVISFSSPAASSRTIPDNADPGRSPSNLNSADSIDAVDMRNIHSFSSDVWLNGTSIITLLLLVATYTHSNQHSCGIGKGRASQDDFARDSRGSSFSGFNLNVPSHLFSSGKVLVVDDNAGTPVVNLYSYCSQPSPHSYSDP